MRLPQDAARSACFSQALQAARRPRSFRYRKQLLTSKLFLFLFSFMDTLLDCLRAKEEWEAFLLYKKEKNQLSRREQKQLETFIAEERYLQRAEDLRFSYPEKKEITKLGSSKKRTVYSYPEDETWILKLLAWKLYKYDGRIADSCYSFRRSRTAKTAFDSIRKITGLDKRYVLKLDIHDYFNSIDTELLLSCLSEIIDDDPKLLSFLAYILHQDRCIRDGEIIEEKRGAMAGVPLASFFANVYLKDLDLAFEEKGIPYFRYSDDMIFFFESREALEAGLLFTEELLARKKLTLNMDKYRVSPPGEKWEFLGFSYEEGKIDLSDATVDKMKGKIRRKARKLYRWRIKKGASFERAAKAMIRSFDHKFYDLTGDNDFTWTRFYFPVINCSDGLKEIDRYMQQYLRYLSTGRHTKANYRVSYEDLKKLGYTPLAAEYYNWMKENELLNAARH